MTDAIRNALKECASRCRYDGDLFHDQGNEMRRDASWRAADMANAALAAAPSRSLAGTTPELQKLYDRYSGDPATPAFRDEDQEYAETMRSVAQLLRADSASKAVLDTKIAALAERLWRVHPKEIQDLGITRQQYYEREIRSLFDAATPAVDDAVLNSYADENQRFSDRIEDLEAEVAALNSHFDAAYEAAGLSRSSSKPLAHHIMQLLAATPAVGGEREALDNLVDAIECELDVEMRSFAFRKRFAAAKDVLAAQPASPLRGRDIVEAALTKAAKVLRGCRGIIEGDYRFDIVKAASDCDKAIAALLAAPPEQPAAGAPAHPQYLDNCQLAGECHGQCNSETCTNYGKMIVIRRCVENYPSFAERNLIDRFGWKETP